MEHRELTIDNEAIGKRIREERERLRLNREEFAEMIGLSPFYLGQLERGERQMSLTSFFKISCHLNISTDFLIFGGNDENNDIKNRIGYLLNRCGSKDLVLIEEMIKLLISHIHVLDQ